MIQEDNCNILRLVRDMCTYLNETNSSKEKIDRLDNIFKWKAWGNKEAMELGGSDFNNLEKVLVYTYSPYITFGVTGDAVRSWMSKSNKTAGISGDLFAEELTVFELLDRLASRDLTGHEALRSICDVILYMENDIREIFYNVLDKNLKIRMDAKSINKVVPGLIPIFEVSLCHVYEDKCKKVNFLKDRWFASRKMDGCRCIVRIDNQGKATAFSRQGKEFKTLNNLLGELSECRDLWGYVLDGECCIVDENGDEDFKSIMKEITRKDHTIAHPMYQVFDLLTIDEFDSRTTMYTFEERLKALNDVYSKNFFKHSRMTEQILITSQEHFQKLFNTALENGWEGMVIRKDDRVICKRSDSMLKVKAFKDAEYVVESVEMGMFPVLKDGVMVEEEVMAKAFIRHKGNIVGVGSGWSLNQRRFYKEYPEELIGKTITVQYFEETMDKDGNLSLRFPTCKFVYEDKREV